MLTNKYLGTVKNLQDIMKKIIELAPPEKFTIDYLKQLGFKSSNDYRVVRFLKDIWFLSESGYPTNIYHEYRNPNHSRRILGQIVKEMYGDIFLMIENPQRKDSKLIRDLFKSTHGVSNQLALFMTNTFFALFELSDVHISDDFTNQKVKINKNNVWKRNYSLVLNENIDFRSLEENKIKLNYNIELHLPETKDKEVYDLIFSSLREQLLNSKFYK